LFAIIGFQKLMLSPRNLSTDITKTPQDERHMPLSQGPILIVVIFLLFGALALVYSYIERDTCISMYARHFIDADRLTEDEG
jgi:hypothetical protein